MGKFGELMGATGAGAVDSAVGAVLGLALGGVNDKRQIKQQGKLNEQQIAGNKEMGKFNQELQMDMWNKTNYGAQMAHMKDAGLNPALMYGMGGGGGTTTGSGSGTGGVSGADAPKGGGEAMGMMQMGLMQAQKANIEADTANKKASNPDLTNKGGLSGIELEVAGANKNKRIEAEGWKHNMVTMSGEQANIEWEAMKTAIAGSMEDKENPLVKAKLAELEIKVEGLKAVRAEVSNKIKEGTLKDDEHELKMIEKEINGFTADLSNMGVNNTTMSLILKILGGVMGVRMKK